MAQSISPESEKVAAFYDNTTAMEIIFGQDIHLGLWPQDSSGTLAQAQTRLTDLVIAKSGSREGLRVLDVGCGTGGPARRLAATTGASVTGITLSPRQVEEATTKSRAQALADRTTFQLADAAQLPFADEEFDAAIAIESIMHMPDKSAAFREIARVLRPGAPLVTADLTRRPTTAAGPAGFPMLEFLDMCPPGHYGVLAREAGFEVVEALDISSMVRPSYAQWQASLPARLPELAAAWGPDTTKLMEEGGTQFLTAALTGQIGYDLMTARRQPAQP